MSRTKWKDPTMGERTQFVADILDESLFDYAFDSNKVPSLNLHFFCVDFIKTHALVEDGIMREGNMIPLVEEFECIVNKSIWLPCNISNSMLQFKNKNGVFVDASKDKALNSNTRSKYYLENAKFVRGLLEADKNYFSLLIDEIETILRNSSFSFAEKKRIYFCTRELLSELINAGVNKTHLYNQVRTKLFSGVTPDDDVEYVISFLRSLAPVLSEYVTVFGITDEAYYELKDIFADLRPATDEEAAALSTKYVAENTFTARDPVSALVIGKGSFSVLLSVFNACKHDTNIKVTPKGLVRHTSEDQFHLINESKGLLSKNKNKKRQEREKWLLTAINRPISKALISAFELHNTALEIDDPQTQLLNLWTIFELLIETNQDFMNRINYITNILCSQVRICV